VVTTLALVLSGLFWAVPPAQAATPDPSAPSTGVASMDTLNGFISAPGGPFLRDRYGRAIILHGVNAVYKLPPYELPLRSQRVERQHRQLLAALAGATHQVLCVPRGDLRRNIERLPSRWVLQMASARRDWITHVASFDAGIRRVDFPARNS
jgi:hypothetical protein